MIKEEVKEIRDYLKEGTIKKRWLFFWLGAIILSTLLMALPSGNSNYKKTQENEDALLKDTQQGQTMAVDTLLKELQNIKKQQRIILLKIDSISINKNK